MLASISLREEPCAWSASYYVERDDMLFAWEHSEINFSLWASRAPSPDDDSTL